MKLFIGHQNLNMNYCSSTAKTCNSCSIRIFTYLQQQTPRQELFLINLRIASILFSSLLLQHPIKDSSELSFTVKMTQPE